MSTRSHVTIINDNNSLYYIVDWSSDISRTIAVIYWTLIYFLFVLRDFDALDESLVEENTRLGFDVAEQELGISPLMTVDEMLSVREPDSLSMVVYLSQFYQLLKDSPPPAGECTTLRSEKLFIHRNESETHKNRLLNQNILKWTPHYYIIIIIIWIVAAIINYTVCLSACPSLTLTAG